SAHLLGARGAWYLLSHQPRRTGDSGAKFPLFAQFLTSQRLAPPTRWSEIQAERGVPELGKWVGVGLIAAGVSLAVATILADVLSGGLSLADDPATLAAAGAMIGTGITAF